MTPQTPEDGSKTAGSAPTADALARVAAEQALRESEARFKSALKAGRMGS